ncbi:MAG: helix-turn-helix domain-containing protein [Acidobacteria bacterium]|nr:helix-turn-helix domain-containing protein [Acidobacteriota bacterium]
MLGPRANSKVENLIRQIRQAAGLNQSDFARLLGRSIQSLQGYERGRVPPAEVVEKLKVLARQHNRADLVPALEGHPTAVARVIPRRAAERQRWHDILDEILDSTEADAITAVEQALSVFANYVRAQQAKLKKKA